jgi:hypothetical protein
MKKKKKKTQVDDSGYPNLRDPAEKMRVNTGNRWNMEAVFQPDFSGGFL